MSGEKDLEQIKREAAEKAKALAKQRLAAKQNGEGNAEQPATEKIVKPQGEAKAAGEDADLAKKKAAAAAKAKAAALAKMKATDQTEDAPKTPAREEDADLAKKKAAAAAKAKAAALAKMKATGQTVQGDESAGGDDADLAKKKAAAVAKAKAAAAAKAKAAAMGGEASGGSAADEKAKAIAAAKAKAAAAAKAKMAPGSKNVAEEPAEEKKPSPNQVYLDKYVKAISDNLGADVLEDSYINTLSKDVPTLIAKQESYGRLAAFLKFNELLSFDYLSELHGTDFQTHMEVYVHLYSYKNRQSVALKVKLDRNQPVTQSVQPLWAGADWPECETYDLLGIKFEGHPNLHRIMLGEDWVGHPLRKDYEPYDVEV